jgi:hypothetical protein
VEGAPPPSDAHVAGGAADESATRECPRCGTAYEPGQEYCLVCGLRLPADGGVVNALGGAWRRRVSWYPGDWIWPALLGLLIAAVSAAVVILVNRQDHGSGPIVATAEPVIPPAVDTGTVGETVPTTGATQPTTTRETTTAPTTTRTQPKNRLVQWPARRSGFTVVLDSLPVTTGHARALAEARSALNAGLPDVGVLESAKYSSLHPGYYVVFSGIYTSSSQASAEVSRARAAGFPTAYPRPIAR